MTAGCTTGWCDQPCDGVNHNRSRYVPARLSYIREELVTGCNGSMVPNVGVAIRYDEEELPGITVHIVGGGKDAEGEMTWHEAVQLRHELDEAIRILGGFLAKGFTLQARLFDPQTGKRISNEVADS